LQKYPEAIYKLKLINRIETISYSAVVEYRNFRYTGAWTDLDMPFRYTGTLRNKRCARRVIDV